METVKFKINKPESGNGERKSIKRTILSKAGFTLVGGLAGAVIGANGRKPETASEEIGAEEEVPQEVQDLLNESPQESTQQQTQQDDITEPQPMDSNYSANNSEDNATEVTDDPRDVAQSIANEIDPNDIDPENIITVDGYDYAFLPDGTQQQVFIGHTPDGTQYILADLDGDGMYGDIFDISGNYVTEVAGVSESDLAEAIDETGGYIDGMLEAWETGGTSSEMEELAETETVSEEEMLAQLGEGESEDEHVVKVEEGPSEGIGDSSEDEEAEAEPEQEGFEDE